MNVTLPLTEGTDYAYIQALENSEEQNKAVEYYIQVRQGGLTFTEVQARILLLAHLMYPKAFKVLRTKELLGYLAFTTSWIQATAAALVIQVQGDKDPSIVVSRIDIFLSDYRGNLKDMRKEEFEDQRDALVEKLEQDPIYLDAKAVRLAHPYLPASDPPTDPKQRKNLVYFNLEF
jgi:insulysin